jgi:hypothetical protein
MDIRDFLELDSSRLNADILADKIEEDPDAFDVVWDIMIRESGKIAMRAAWSLTIFAKKHPYFIEPRLPDIIALLQQETSNSVKRCLLNLLTLNPPPGELSGLLFDICFDILEYPSAEIAHKAYAMTILYNISELEPELKPELVDLLESQAEDESAGVNARCRILLKKLYRDLSLPDKSNH